MADKKISELTALTGADTATDDQLVIVDTSAGLTKSITVAEFQNALDGATGFVRITGDTMTGALDVQSTITSDGLTVDGDAVFTTGDTIRLNTSDGSDNGVLAVAGGGGNSDARGAKVRFYGNEHASLGGVVDIAAGNVAGGHIYNYTNAKLRQKIDYNGDVSFFEDTGSTAKLYWSAADERLGIGTDSPKRHIHLNGGNESTKIQITNQTTGSSSDGDGFQIGIATDGTANLEQREDAAMQFSTNNDLKMTIDSSGNVGIGTVSPSRNLTVSSSSQTDLAIIAGASSSAQLQFGDSSDDNIGQIEYSNSTNHMAFYTNADLKMTIDSSGRVGIGTSATTMGKTNISLAGVAVTGDTDGATIGAGGILNLLNSNGGVTNSTTMLLGSTGSSAVGQIASGIGFTRESSSNWGTQLRFYTHSTSTSDLDELNEAMRIKSTGDVGIGTGGDFTVDDITGSGYGLVIGSSSASSAGIQIRTGTSGAGNIYFGDNSGSDAGRYDGFIQYSQNSRQFNIGTARETAMTIDSSGNLLVGKTSSSGAVAGGEIRPSGLGLFTVDDDYSLQVRRLSEDGDLVHFYKDTNKVGSIGVESGSLYIGGGDVGFGFYQLSDAIVPINASTGALRDNAIDLGINTTGRYDDIYATNGTIQTSDRNEKQDIAELSDAEQRVAVAAKGLLRKFRWRDAVEAKGDEARTHFGIIAQDLQAAFSAEGLDAGNYAMFISSTWTDEKTGEERTRMGVRYSELLAFIIAAI